MPKQRKRGPGRPKLGADARSVVVPVRITKAQRKAIDSLVGAGPVPDWIRSVIVAALTTTTASDA